MKIEEISFEIERQKEKLDKTTNVVIKNKISENIARLHSKLIHSLENKEIPKEEVYKVDKFHEIKITTEMIGLGGHGNSLLITGQSGVGKTNEVTTTLDSMGIEYMKISGYASSSSLYQTLFNNKNSLLLFDDCDSIFKDQDSINILKASLDTYDIRRISKFNRGHLYFDPTNIDEETFEKNIKKGKLPTYFDFTGRIIFISNLPEERFDKAFLSRSKHINIKMTNAELLDRMKDIILKINIDLPDTDKIEVLEYVYSLCTEYNIQDDINIRTLIHSLNTKKFTKDTLDKNGNPMWKTLINNQILR